MRRRFCWLLIVRLSGLSPLRGGCLRLAPVSPRFPCPDVLYLWADRSDVYFVRALDVEQRTGFEPAPPVWKTGVLTVKHQRCLLQLPTTEASFTCASWALSQAAVYTHRLRA